ncbi:tandem-95 repeat protein [Cellulomonas triticagri]|uniref:Tandem-95 repeat protein n=1 Tax=Cellulomonas triticagri TaxID=2483352 RepID=A0A3M2J5E4_9CELL|nr:tandem-95 repeat protein [Cellulomonas triticagri]
MVSVPAVVATLALVNPGFPLAQVDLNDGAVWLTSTSTLQVGRYNAQVEELNAGLTSTSAEFDVLQEAGNVLIVEPGMVSVVDPAGVVATTQVAVPAGAQVSMAGGTVAVMDPEGQAWVRTFADLPLLQVTADEPDAEVGDDGLVVATTTGVALAVAGTTGEVTRLSPSAGGATQSEASAPLDGPVEALTAVGDVPVGLDGDTVRTPGGSSALGMAQPVLQQAGPASGTALVAGSTGLVEVALSSGDVAAEHEAGGSGTPAAPVRVGTCAHGAWPTGTLNYLRLCDDAEPELLDLAGVTSTDHLVFRVNRQVVALNETLEGRLWLPLEDTQLREPEWTDVVPEEQPDDDTEQSEGDRTTTDLVPECSPTSAAPNAVDDEFGVRAGRTTILPVIDNDTSSDCGILVITDVDPLPAEFGTLQQVYGGRALQVSVPADATGSTTFSYTINDGRGATAPSTAQVTLTVRGAGQDDPPVQDRVGEIRVEQNATATYPVLADFSDPDGDPLTLVGAVAESGTARFRQDGTLTYVADGGNLGRTVVRVLVSDGTHTSEGTVDVDVRAPGSLPIQLDPVHAQTYTGQDVDVNPLAAVRSFGAERPRLAGVEDVAGTTVTPDLENGTFTFRAAQAGTYYVSFTVTAPPQQATGLARIDVLEAPDEVQPPVAVLDRAWLPAGGQTTINPLDNDSDPAGGVLVLQSVEAPDELRVAVRQREIVTISAVGALTEPVTLQYVVSNGVASATGQILVSPVPASSTSQPPVVPNVTADVRTGGVVTIPVLEDAYDPDGDELTLKTEFAEPLGDGQGLMFVSGDALRFQAPATPMTVRATFVVQDSTGNETAATVTVRVHESDPETKAPPRPRALTARVFAGETVRIPVPLVGIDTDGDGITLLGVASAGTKGRVATVGADYLEYEALPGEAGTDTFTYAVEDWTGQRAVATVRVGIAARPGDSNRVVARDDNITVRPGQTVEVRVLENDTDVAGGTLSLLDDLEADPGVTAEVRGSRVQVTGTEAGVFAVGYTAQNQLGSRAGAVLTVTVDPEAPVLPPVARDVVVPPIDTIGRTTVDVDVLGVAQNPSGPLGDLSVSVPRSAADAATVAADGTVTVTLAETAQTIPYLLTNTTDESARSYAFISVPALGFFPPTVRPRAPELRVASGETITIPLDEQVQVAPGRTAQVADPTAVTATRSDGSSLVVDSTTVQYTPAVGYVGPASITVPVTDATGPDDTSARTSVITLSVTVYTIDDYPPTFVPSALLVGPGEAPTTVDLMAFTQGVEGASGVETYTYRITGEVPAGFTASLSGTRLSVASDVSTPKGTRGTLQLQIGYGRAGTMDVQVELRTVASTRRVASVPDRSVNDGVQGQETVVDVLSGAYNPFPEQPLRVVGASVETSGTGTASVSGSNVVIRPSADLVGQMVVSVRVRDATDDSAREVAATVTLRVRGKPAAPAAPRVGEVRDSTVVLSWTAPDNRGEPITGYRVTGSPGLPGGARACSSTTCTIDGLTNNVEYTFTVAAENAVGWSDPSPASAVARPDAVPSAPGAPRWTGFGDGTLNASWDAPATTGSPVTSYTLMLSPAPPRGSSTVTTSGTSYQFTGLENGTAYTLQVRAHNRAPDPSPWSPASATETPSAPPAAPTVTAERVGTQWGGQINVAWSPNATNGAAIQSYRLEYRRPGGSWNGVNGINASTSWAFQNAENGVEYEFRVRATNRAGEGPEGTARATAFGIPDAPGNVQASAENGRDAGQGRITLSWSAPANVRGAPITGYNVMSNGQVIRTGLDPRRTEVPLENLQGGTTLTLQVQACNSAGCGEWSGAASATVTTKPGTVDRGSISGTPSAWDGRKPTQATISWSGVQSGGSEGLRYVVEVESRAGVFGRWTRIGSASDVTGTSTPVALTDVPENGQFQARVLAVTNAHEGSWSEWQDIALPWTAAQPETPPGDDPDPGDGSG